MDFKLTSEQELFQDSLRRLLASGDQVASRHRWQELADMGVFAAAFPEDKGGLGGSAIETMLAMGEFGRALYKGPMVSAVVRPGTLLSALGVGDVLLAALMSGERTVVLAHAEQGGAGAAEHIRTTATRTSGGYRLDGRKSVAIGAGEADTLLVTARSGDGGFPGIGLFLLNPEPMIVDEPFHTIDGFAAADLRLDGTVVPESALLASACDDALRLALDTGIIALCAEAVGAMEAALWLTNDYLKTRKQFGVAIGSFQALQHRMAEMYVDLELARSMLYRGVASLDGAPGERSRMVSGAKALIGRIGKHIGAEAVQLHGGIGVSEEHAIGRYFKRLVCIEAQSGNSRDHLKRFAA